MTGDSLEPEQQTTSAAPPAAETAKSDSPTASNGAERTFGERRRNAEALAETLTPRQREVLAQLLRGASVKEIAASLGLSQHTVHEYVKELHRHFNVSSRGELLALFVPTWF